MAADLPFDYDACFQANPLFKKSDITELKTWVERLEATNIIPKDISEKQLLVFHNACNLKISDTKKCIKTYYSVRDKAPEHFDNRDFTVPTLKEAVVVKEFGVLPVITDEGYSIIYHGLHDSSPDKYNFNAVVKILMMTIDRCIYERGPQKGFLFLFDMQGVRLNHMTRLNIMSLSKFFSYIQDGLPVKIVKIHILNVVPFYDKIMAMVKPFMKKELVNMIALYPPNTDMEKFFAEVLPKRYVISDFGGDLPDRATLNKENIERLTEMKPFFDAEERHRHSYSKAKRNGRGLFDMDID